MACGAAGGVRRTQRSALTARVLLLRYQAQGLRAPAFRGGSLPPPRHFYDLVALEHLWEGN